MKRYRLLLVLLVAASVIMLPLATAATMLRAETAAAMSAPSDDCPCCKPAKAQACPLKCCLLQAILPQQVAIMQPQADAPITRIAVIGAAVTHTPDPPPPRG